MTQHIVIGSDHGGFELKETLVAYLRTECKVEVTDVGTFTSDRVDYPDIAHKVVTTMKDQDVGIVVCGTGIGISIAANKLHGVRCALCHDHYTAMMARQHNDANVLALGGRVLGVEIAKEIVHTFMNTSFLGQRHAGRVEKIMRLES